MDDNDRQILRHVAEHDCSVICIEADEDTPAFCYTVGLFQRFRAPEVLILGLPHEPAHELLIKCRDACRAGDLLRPMHSYGGFLKDPYRLAAREISRDHYDGYLGYARWFYAGDEFPAVQAFWPDRQGRYPWDKACDPDVARAQPRLDFPWPFVGEPVTKRAWTLTAIRDGARPVLRVVHEADGEWQLLGDDAEIRDEDVALTTLGAALDLDPSLAKVGPLPKGWFAWRDSAEDQWGAEPESED